MTPKQLFFKPDELEEVSSIFAADVNATNITGVIEQDQKFQAFYYQTQQKIESLQKSMAEYAFQQQTATLEVSEKLSKLCNISQKKGSVGEELLAEILAEQFPEFVITQAGQKSGDIKVAHGDWSVMIEVKNYTKTVPSLEVDKFMRDV